MSNKTKKNEVYFKCHGFNDLTELKLDLMVSPYELYSVHKL